MNLFNYITNIYTKKRDISDIDMSTNIVLTKWLSFDVDNLNALKQALPYIFHIEPKHYYYLIYYLITKKTKVPFLNKSNKVETKKDKLMEKIQQALNWSNKEMAFNKSILNKVIDVKHWKNELGGN